MYRKASSMVAAVAFSLLSLTANAGAETTLRMSSWAPPTHPVTTDILGGWATDVERVTNGRVKIEMLKTPVGAPTSYFDVVRNGIVDVSFVTHDFTPNRFVLTRVSQLPFLVESAEASSVALWRTSEKFFQKADEHKGVKVLALMVHGPGQLFTGSRPVRSLEDFKGLKVRGSAAVMTDVITALGGVVVSAPPPKSYEVLSNGVVDGTLFPFESIMGFNLTPLVKHATTAPGGFYTTSFVVMMNAAKWDKLPAADKDAIWSVSGEGYSRRAGAVWDQSDRIAQEKLKAAGVEVVEANGRFLDQLKERLSPMAEGWVKQAAQRGVDGNAALAYYREQLRAAKSH